MPVNTYAKRWSYKGKRSTAGRAEYEKLKVILSDQDDGVETVIEQLTSIERKLKGKKNKKRRELFHAELNYFKNQKDRMRYAEYQKRGLPIGSGVIETTCKTLSKGGNDHGQGGRPADRQLAGTPFGTRSPVIWS